MLYPNPDLYIKGQKDTEIIILNLKQTTACRSLMEGEKKMYIIQRVTHAGKCGLQPALHDSQDILWQTNDSLELLGSREKFH